MILISQPSFSNSQIPQFSNYLITFAAMVLVTGATGLVGSHLILHLLENGEDVSAIYRSEKSIAKTKSLFELYKKEQLFTKINWIQGDINDIPSLELAFENIQYVYHCAAFISFNPFDEEKIRKINIEGTSNIVNFCLDRKVKKLAYVSSIAALGDLPDYEQIITEKTDWNPEKPHSDYAISKYGAEMEIWRGQQEGLDVVVVNPGVILGPVPSVPGWNEGSGKIFYKVAKGSKYYTKGSSGFIAVTDVVQIIYKMMKGNFSGEQYILVAENIIFQDLMNEIAESLKVEKPTAYAKKWMTEIAWRLDWICANLFFAKRKLPRSVARSLHTTDLYSNEKIKQDIGFEFTPIKNYIKEIAGYYKN
ncbi:NAD-dependent epimerase/dehydratase family protein [Flavobacterium soli]|uniref:NAD-dependent epimerase/dehydratase family protein n=1 Tax=Flavobacterium soli TaxID=344881 RepID=UPI00316ABC99